MTDNERLESLGIFVDDLIPSKEEEEKMLKLASMVTETKRSDTISGTFGTFKFKDTFGTLKFNDGSKKL